MHANDWMQIVLFFGALIALTPVLGGYMARVYDNQAHLMSKPLGWLERLTYKISGVDATEGMNWKRYCGALLWFNLLGFLAVWALQMMQQWLPLNPQGMPAVTWHSAFNTAASFVTNTNWQGYGGESTMAYLTQLLALTVQNFLSAATGMAAMVALIRGLRNKQNPDLGNFWADLVRTTVHILLPISLVFAVFLTGQGVVQNLRAYDKVKTVEGADQVLAQGPAASQVAIKQIGTNGGGFFNANSAHPYENPTPLSNFFEMLAILLIPSACVWTFGVMIGKRKEAIALWATMALLFGLGLAVALYAEFSPNPVFHLSGLMEGKETRFGVTNSILWTTSCTATSNGSVNAMIDSFSPLAGGVCMLNIMLGEVIFGGVGCGLYGMLIFVLMTVFMAGLMVGRTPEYLGKKLVSKDVQWVVLAIILPNACIKIGSAIAAVTPVALASLNNAGPHGLSEILYAFSSFAGNNGSAFAGLNANTVFYNVIGGVMMLL
ncbi:MAG TPA: potassium-transporting ATPase subunit KdpA, partial [bacterium]|nr:potassium-transporting ATPase subunit KdpA [bacterium]